MAPSSLSLESLRYRKRADLSGRVFYGLLVAAIAVAFLLVAAVMTDVVRGSLDLIGERTWGFLTSPSSSDPEKAGAVQAVRGTVVICAIVALTFPIGIGAAIYLEEYAEDNWVTRLIQVAVRNLAGVPSIVYGLLGLAVFVQSLRGLTGGSSVIAGSLTLAVLVLPIVVITSAEAIRAVPSAYRDGAYGLGATQWEAIRTQVLPAALPGILTGTVLSIARAAGEAAPLLVVGAAPYYTTGNNNFLEQLQGAFTALPMSIATFARLPADTWRGHAAFASLVLLVLVFLINLIAIIGRARFARRLGR